MKKKEEDDKECVVKPTRLIQQIQHPLLRYDPHILEGGVQLVKLEYFEAETTRAPVPRNQEVPKEAFGTLTGRCIVVATSHAWFYQCHPDPNGVKLAILREQFFPRLRKRFPRTQILVFDDWHSCPQWPRITQEEENRFQKCMDHMNSIYCYSDVVLFVDAELPKLDNTIYKCDLVPSKHKWLNFVDTIQYVGGNDNILAIRENDIVVALKDRDSLLSVDILKQTKEVSTILFMRRPYGRPNQVPPEERGWLYAERINVAIRMAAASLASFEEVVFSNNPILVKQIFSWSRDLRNSAQRESKHPGSIANQLKRFEKVLATMKFTRPGDEMLVDEIMASLIKQFEMNWNEETQRQSDMAKRAREILLRWGEFSEEYVEKARFLQNSNEFFYGDIVRFLTILVVIPAIPVIPFTMNVTSDISDVFKTSFFAGILLASVGLSIIFAVTSEFANIPIVGLHALFNILYGTIVPCIQSLFLRFITGLEILPYEVIFIAIFNAGIFDNIFVFPKYFQGTDERTGEKKRLSLQAFLMFPPNMRYSAKARDDLDRTGSLILLTYCFGLVYPILSGIFFNAGSVVAQSFLIILFFSLRALYEYVRITNHSLTHLITYSFTYSLTHSGMQQMQSRQNNLEVVRILSTLSHSLSLYPHAHTHTHTHTHTQMPFQSSILAQLPFMRSVSQL